ncbi:hypothetical protein [Streptomyces chartreusis]|uniref:Uncharacterized protein n=1 Tax=Streptomyces chartreusis TaxID=1969 RepID=A0A7H8TP12_STRCX|nr:hypothetical protein [Streptomyces chartreusis]QKZ23860.1 hypothetical protein HUT05_44800 [Streptomyces chartreusis]
MTSPTPPIPVDILDATTVNIHGEPIAVPPGVDPDQAVMSYLQLEAAGVGHPISARIDDQRYSIKATLTINPDGTASAGTPTSAPAPQQVLGPTPAQAIEHPLAAVQRLATQGSLSTAIDDADRYLLQLSTDPALGPEHPETLEAAETRAHLAWLARDFPYAYRTWSWIAAAWHDRAGPCPRNNHAHDHNQCRHTMITTRNAAAAWTQLPVEEGAATGQDMLNLLERISGVPNTPAARDITTRLRELTARTA